MLGLNAIDMYGLIGNVLNGIAIQRLNYVYNNVSYFREHCWQPSEKSATDQDTFVA